MGKNNKITVLGAGLWGTVLAEHLSRGKAAVWLWEFFGKAATALSKSRRHPHIPGFSLDRVVHVTSDLAEAVAEAEVMLFVLPSHFVRSTARQAAACGAGGKRLLVNASKGIEPKTLMTMGDVIASELPSHAGRIYTLSGPSFAREVARGVPTSLVLAGSRSPSAEKLRRLFDGGCLRTVLSVDRKGVELGGSLKNVLAIGCGVLDGLQAGANTKAALLIQGMAEMGRLFASCGGKAETAYGLAGLGDLIATGTSPQSRNRAFGEKLGRGKTTKQAVGEIPTVVEGIEAALSAHALGRKAGLRLPLIDAVWGVVHRDRPAALILESLGFKRVD